jgi:ribosomal protein L7/L12
LWKNLLSPGAALASLKRASSSSRVRARTSKLYQQATGVGLKQAKEFIEEV